MWLKQSVAHPTRGNFIRTSIILVNAIPEFVPETGRNLVIAIKGRYACSTDHAAQPWCFFHQKGADAQPGGLNGSGCTGCASSNDENISRNLLAALA